MSAATLPMAIYQPCATRSRRRRRESHRAWLLSLPEDMNAGIPGFYPGNPVLHSENPVLHSSASHEEALRNAQDAIALWIEAAREDGPPIPNPKGRRLVYA